MLRRHGQTFDLTLNYGERKRWKNEYIYVGNLGYDVTETELQAAFEAYGEVESARIIMDRDSGRSKG